MSEQLTIKNLYNHMDETIAKDIFEGATYPWEILPKISGFIKELGKTLPADEYDQVGEDVWIAKSATVFQTAYIHGPAIIGKNAEVRQCAFIRGNAIVGEGAVVGNSTEPRLQIPHGGRIHHIQCQIRQKTRRSKSRRRKDRDRS